MRVVFEQPLDRQVLTEMTGLKVDVRELRAPERVVLIRERVDCLGGPTVDRQVRLRIAGEVVVADRNATGDR